MKKKIMACILSACLLLTVLSPVMGTIAEDTLQEVTLPVLEQVKEPAPQPETETPAEKPAESAPTEEPSAPAEEAASDPEATTEPAAGETAEPTPAPEATEEPAPEETEAVDDQPSQEPAEEPTPAPEQSAEPAPEPSVEPEASVEPAEPLAIRMALDRSYAFAGDNVCAVAEVAGGVAPYTLTLRVYLNNASVEQTITAETAGRYGLNYKPENFGVHTFEMEAVDAAGVLAQRPDGAVRQ